MNYLTIKNKVALAMLDAILKNSRTQIKKPEEYLAKLIEREYQSLYK